MTYFPYIIMNYISIISMLGISITTIGPYGTIWVLELARRMPWSNIAFERVVGVLTGYEPLRKGQTKNQIVPYGLIAMIEMLNFWRMLVQFIPICGKYVDV